MWRSVRYAARKHKVHKNHCHQSHLYATSTPKGSAGTGRKVLVALAAVSSVGSGAAIVYGKYDPEFRKLVEDNVPYSSYVFNALPNWDSPKEQPSKKSISDAPVTESAVESSLLKKKQERLKMETKPILEPPKTSETKVDKLKEDIKKIPISDAIKSMPPAVDNLKKTTSIEDEKHLNDFIVESTIKELMHKLDRSLKEAISAQETLSSAVKTSVTKTYEALETPDGPAADEVWKEALSASSAESFASDKADTKVSTVKLLLVKLKDEVRKANENVQLKQSPVIVSGKGKLTEIEQQLRDIEAKVIMAKDKAKAAADYQQLVKKAREQFKSELQIVLPKYVHKNKEQSMTEDELNLLIAHAHRRIENLQKELARQQVTEKQRIEEAMNTQRTQDEKLVCERVAVEVKHRMKKADTNFQKHVEFLREEFESDMRQQLRRQAAAHADHIQEALQVQQHELERKHTTKLEKELLSQKGEFISEISESSAHLTGIESFLKARAQLDECARKTRAIWLACHAMKSLITAGLSTEPKPLSKEVAILKTAAGDENNFVTTVLGGIPMAAVQRGIYTEETLKQKFNTVKRNCRRVANIDDDNRSLYRYFISYLQSIFIADSAFIPKAEIEGKIAVDTSEWDTFDVLSRISYCLQISDMEQALRYANQLRGEPRNVAKDWISELRLLLEITQAVDCLITYAAAVGMQAYH